MGEITAATDAAWRVEVRGVVQGVGFRPFVYRLATHLGLRGDVRNTGGHVTITVAGASSQLEAFVAGLRTGKPEAAVVGDVAVTPVEGLTAPTEFRVLESVGAAANRREIPPDLRTCTDCVRELFDPADRRHRYPFINCTACGPRATIIDALPYDRIRTTMRSFPMCAACAREYRDPADRRFHAEPIACPECGPRLRWGSVTGEEALLRTAAVISAGGVAAVKGLGGYQLVCDATREGAVTRVREVKGRPAKPLAVMVPGLDWARRLARLTPEDERLLNSTGAPIVLAPAMGSLLGSGVRGGMPDVGLFLPYTPLHHLLLAVLDRPLVVTSANRADSPMLTEDDQAIAVLGPLTDGVLTHNRVILNRYDDSVSRVVTGRTTLIRRARGYAPGALTLPVAAPEPLLGVGAQLKSTFTLASGNLAVLGPHIGDLEDAETLEAFETALARFEAVHDVRPRHVAHDLHPAYLSTALARTLARRLPAGRRLAVQHHHAHIAAVAAEHGLTGPVLGVAYDGLGLGDDGTFWGGELLLSGYTGYRRLGRFSRAPMPGGTAAVRRPVRMALGYLFGAERFGTGAKALPDLADGRLRRVPRHEVELTRRMISREINTPTASSAGRLFDAVAALLSLCDDNRFEGEAAMRLEQAAAAHPGTGPLAWRVERREGLWVYDAAATLHDLLTALADGEPVGRAAAAFHATIAAVTVLLCERAAQETGVSVVCLSGGVFQNRLLAAQLLRRLEQTGFDAYIGERVPVNDGGISYGQAVVAAARLASPEQPPRHQASRFAGRSR
ncbi:carbamoyltransferase HypF [Microbispora triticiradicis]|uniref:carbamoyltransferase HypF n=1 Tax=Microbispora triticiradicis TaxID=2200763 RepID=UPI001AD61FB3|nr:carbamoyltransferase HypF [Microbispora triticiradicis]MBO4269565.1 carbamoyltransferase HypF [Microbispora triticiradicis]